MIKYIFFFSIIISVLNAKVLPVDRYNLIYSAKSKKCTLYKNGKKIDLLDKKYKEKNMTTPYTCSTIQISNYRGCRIVKGSESITAYAFSFGVYGEQTKLLFGYKVAVPSVNAFLKLKCSRESFNF